MKRDAADLLQAKKYRYAGLFGAAGFGVPPATAPEILGALEASSMAHLVLRSCTLDFQLQTVLSTIPVFDMMRANTIAAGAGKASVARLDAEEESNPLNDGGPARVWLPNASENAAITPITAANVGARIVGRYLPATVVTGGAAYGIVPLELVPECGIIVPPLTAIIVRAASTQLTNDRALLSWVWEAWIRP